jgi:hypothetical protein
MYVSPAQSQLQTAIENNIVANVAIPFARISFGAISNHTELSTEEVITKLRTEIRHGRIHGPLHFVNRDYEERIGSAKTADLVPVYERSVAARENLEIVLLALPLSSALKESPK